MRVLTLNLGVSLEFPSEQRETFGERRLMKNSGHLETKQNTDTFDFLSFPTRDNKEQANCFIKRRNYSSVLSFLPRREVFFDFLASSWPSFL